jgi:hypothetical protein
MSELMERESQDRTNRSLAILSREQLEKLRAEVERRYRENHEPAIEEPGADKSNTGSTVTGTVTVTSDSDNSVVMFWSPAESETEEDNIVLPAYEILISAVVRKTLGLSADQEKQLREIATDSQARKKEFDREAKELTEAELYRKLREFEGEKMRITKEARQKIEALLTPEQLVKLKDDLFHTEAFGWLIVPEVQDKIGLSNQQKAEINRLNQEWKEKTKRFEQELDAKEFGFLTPGQQDTLREEFDRRGW